MDTLTLAPSINYHAHFAQALASQLVTLAYFFTRMVYLLLPPRINSCIAAHNIILNGVTSSRRIDMWDHLQNSYACSGTQLGAAVLRGTGQSGTTAECAHRRFLCLPGNK